MIFILRIALSVAVSAVLLTEHRADIPADSLFDASTIPPHLLVDADAIIRYHEIDLRVDNTRRSHQTVRIVVTILNAQGRDYGGLSVGYDNFRSIRSFRGELYNAAGQRLKRLRRGDVRDYSMISGISLYEDSRIQTAELYHNTYPYTVYFEYEIRHNGYMNFPDWIIERRRTAVENTMYRLSIPHGMDVRYRNVRYEGEPVIIEERNRTIYFWSATNVSAYEAEPYGPHIQEQVRAVQIAPVEFEIEGYRGDYSSWKTFGKFYHTLSEGRDGLPDDAVRDVERIVAQAENDYDIVKNLFEYMQSRTRYISVQLGIGGWQPFDATFVHERGYGDCKALTNYMMALLGAAGIESFPALIYSGTKPRYLDDNFAVNRFNHVILSVPVDGDTIWLECTSQTIPFGHIGQSNENRKALLITPDGGELIYTPSSSAAENRQQRSGVVRLRPDGDITADITELYTGLQQDRVRHGIVNRSSRDRLEWMNRNIDLPSFNLEAVDYSGVEDGTHEVQLRYTVDVPRYANPMRNRLIFHANFLERNTYVPSAAENRTHNIYFPYVYHDVDSIFFIIPDGYIIEAKPEPVEIDTDFARYTAYVDDSLEGGILYYREIVIKKNVLPSSAFDEFREFFREVVRADRVQIVAMRM